MGIYQDTPTYNRNRRQAMDKHERMDDLKEVDDKVCHIPTRSITPEQEATLAAAGVQGAAAGKRLRDSITTGDRP